MSVPNALFTSGAVTVYVPGASWRSTDVPPTVVRKSSGPVTVTVEARREASGQLCLCVEDSGAGLQPGLGKGVGLANVRAQLASRYDEAAKLRVQPREGGGVRAEIRLPAPAGAA